MKKYRVLLAVGLACSSVTAHAKRVGWCEVRMERAPGGYGEFWSAVVELGDSDRDYLTFRDETFGPAFKKYVEGLQGYAVAPSCGTARTLREAQSRMEQKIEANPSMTFRKTEWSGDFPRASGSEAPDDGPSNALIVKGPTPAEAEAERVLQARRAFEEQRKLAAAQAKSIAETARQDVEIRAAIDKAVEEMRKRGNKQ